MDLKILLNPKNEVEEDGPSKEGRVLFLIRDYESDYQPVVLAHEGFFIDEDIRTCGIKEFENLIDMPKDETLLEPGFYVWEGNCVWDKTSCGEYGSETEFDLRLDGTIRKATAEDMAVFEFPIPA